MIHFIQSRLFTMKDLPKLVTSRLRPLLVQLSTLRTSYLIFCLLVCLARKLKIYSKTFHQMVTGKRAILLRPFKLIFWFGIHKTSYEKLAIEITMKNIFVNC
jgi:hypothetical protein